MVDADVCIHVASFNTAAATELCIRSMRATAGCPFSLIIGDSGSDDGSVAMLRRLARSGWLSLQEAGPRTHHQWLDEWLATCRARYAVFADSDVEFLRDGWLTEMVNTARRHGSVAVYTEMMQEHSDFVELMVNTPAYAPLLAPHQRRRVRLMARPAPWLFLVEVARAQTINRSFAPVRMASDAIHEGRVTYDTGGTFFCELRVRGLPWSLMPASFAGSYRHYGSQSWISHAVRDGRNWRHDLHHARVRLLIRNRLWRLRRQGGG